MRISSIMTEATCIKDEVDRSEGDEMIEWYSDRDEDEEVEGSEETERLSSSRSLPVLVPDEPSLEKKMSASKEVK